MILCNMSATSHDRRFLDISAPHVQTPHYVAVEFVQTTYNRL